jgi:hypothetical protein
MSIPAAALGCALLLSQVESGTGAPDTPAEEHVAPRPASPASSPPVFPLDPEVPLPVMHGDVPILCAEFPPTERMPSGTYRMQCDEKTRECLVSPAHELDAEGVETGRELERVRYCGSFIKGPAHAEQGYRFVPAVADTPPGWYRDERGRVMQFNFDLHRRVWLGAAWAPLWRSGEEQSTERVRMDFGIRTEVPTDEGQNLHRLAFFDTELFLGPRRQLDATLLRYDFSSDRDRPFLRVTTFFGTPRRHDLDLDMGAWLEVLRMEQLTRGGTEASFLTLGTLHATLDLWHSRDLASYVRVRAGPSLERDRTHGFLTLVPGAVLEGDLTLDEDGFHHLRVGLEAEKMFFDDAVEGRPLHPERLRLRAGYETILLALNDQPVSLVLDGRGEWRSDLAGVPAAWEWSAQAGLRFSLWAPARRSARQAHDRKG